MTEEEVAKASAGGEYRYEEIKQKQIDFSKLWLEYGFPIFLTLGFILGYIMGLIMSRGF